MFDEQEILEPTTIDGGEGGGMTPLGPVAEGQSVVRMGASYATAVKVAKPREIKEVRRNLLEEARLMGEAAYYGWGAGKDRIEGPSQALAYSLARLWGNCAIELGPVQETSDAWIFTAYVIDLETGTTVPRQFRQSKRWKVYGKHDSERKADIRFQIGQSKAIRNAVLKALPAWLVDQALGAAKAGVRERIERYIEKNGKAKAIEIALGELAKLGVSEEVVCDRFGVAKPEGLSVENLVTIKGDLKAIQDGETTAGEIYPTGGEGSVKTSEVVGEGDGKAKGEKPSADPEEKPEAAPVYLSAAKLEKLEKQAEDAGLSPETWEALLDQHDDGGGIPEELETDVLAAIQKAAKAKGGK